MKNNSQNGFSLIELLLVIVIIGILSSIAIPSLLKAKSAAENAAAFSMMRMLSTLEVNFYSQNSRYGRATELNTLQGGTLGTNLGTDLVRGNFTYQMSPSTSPTDVQLKDGYTIIATRSVSGSETPYVVSVNQTGVITPVLP